MVQKRTTRRQPTPEGHVETIDETSPQMQGPALPLEDLVPTAQHVVQVTPATPEHPTRAHSEPVAQAQAADDADALRRLERRIAAMEERPARAPSPPRTARGDSQELIRQLQDQIRRLERERPHSDEGSADNRNPPVRMQAFPAVGPRTLVEAHVLAEPRVVTIGNPKNPLNTAIMPETIPRTFVRPTNPRLYQGDSDPQKHLDYFAGNMQFAGASDAITCRCFPMSLGEDPMSWFQSLPTESITCWDDICVRFTRKYASNRALAKTPEGLDNVKQNPGESLRAFLTRFNKEADKISNFVHNTQLYALRCSLHPGPFFPSLSKSRAATLDDFQARASKYISLEDSKATTSKLPPPTLNLKPPTTVYPKPPIPGTDRTVRKTDRGPAGPPRRFEKYAPLNAPVSQIFTEALRNDHVARPKPPRQTNFTDTSKFCAYHNGLGHQTADCVHLIDRVEELVREGRLSDYVRTGPLPGPPRDTRYRSVSPITRIRHSEDRHYQRIQRDRENHTPPRRRSPTSRRRSPSRYQQARDRSDHRSFSIAGGFAGGGPTANSRKRHLKAVLHMQHASKSKPSISRDRGTVITFSDEDYGEETGEDDDPLVIEALISNKSIKRVLVDNGSSADIMFYEAFKDLQLSDRELLPYDTELVGFTGDRVKPLGYFETRVSLGDDRVCKVVQARFLVVDCPTSYQAILGRPTLGRFRAIISGHHYMMKYAHGGRVVTVRGDLKAAVAA